MQYNTPSDQRTFRVIFSSSLRALFSFPWCAARRTCGVLVTLSLAISSLQPVYAQELISVIRAPAFHKDFGIFTSLSSDFNGNGTMDLAFIFVNPERTLHRFAVFEPSTGAQIAAFPISLRYGINQSWFSFKTGDVSGDGYPDIIPYFHRDGYCFDVIDGRTGSVITGRGASSPFSECGRFVDVADLNRDGKNELVVFDEGYTGGEEAFNQDSIPDDAPDAYTSAAVIYTSTAGGGLQEVCRHELDAQEVGTIGGLRVGPDRNGDAIRDIFIGFPSAAGGAGAVVVLSGAGCSLLATDTNIPATTRLGDGILPAGDLDRDGKHDLFIGTKEGSVRYSGASGKITNSIPTTSSWRSTTGDLNRDGVVDLITEVSIPQNSFSLPNSEARILSGKTGKEIGVININRVAEKINLSVPISVDYSKFIGRITSERLSHPSFEANGDGIADFIVRAQNIQLAYDLNSPKESLYLVVSGACPRTPEVTVEPKPNWKVGVGEGPIDVSTWVCGKQYPMTLKVTHNGTTSDLRDDGTGGDRVVNDSWYGGKLAYANGVQKITLTGTAHTEVPFTFSMEQEVAGVSNYKAVGVSPTWVDPADGTTLPGSETKSIVEMITPPFPILFYGDLYTKIQVWTEGFVYLSGRTSMGLPLGPLREDGTASLFIAPYYAKLLPGPGGRISTKTIGQPGARSFVITWENHKHEPLEPSLPSDVSKLTFQLVFQEGNPTLLMNYLKMHSSDAALASGGGGVCKIMENKNFRSTFSTFDTRLPGGTSIAFIPVTTASSPQPGGGAPNGGTNGGPSGGGANIGNSTTPPTPAPFGVSMSAVYSPTAQSLKLDLFPTETSSIQRVDLSQAGCSIDIEGGQRSSASSGLFNKLISWPLTTPLVTKRATKVPGLARQVTQSSKGKSAVASVNLRATVRCPDGRIATSKEVVIKPPARYRGPKLKAEAWVKRVVRLLK